MFNINSWSLDETLENPKGDLSNFCDFQEKHKGGQKHHFALEFFCFLFCFKTKKKSPKAKKLNNKWNCKLSFYFHFVLTQSGAKVKAVFIPFCLGAKLFSLLNLRPFGRFPAELPKWCPRFTSQK